MNAFKKDSEFWWLMRISEVSQVVARSTRAIQNDVNAGKFPAPIRVGPNSVRWISIEVFEWIEEKARASKEQGSALAIDKACGWHSHTVTNLPEGRRLLRMRDVERRTGKSRASLYQAIQKGSFPLPITLSNRRVAWLESEVNDFVRARLIERNKILVAGVEHD